MKLSIVMPVYNEITTIAEAMRRVLSAPVECVKELIIVDDGSTDGTRRYLMNLVGFADAWREDGEVKVLFHERNLGKGAAIRTALPHVTGAAVLIQDADLEYDPQDYATLLQPISDGRADVVFGNRFHGGAHRVLYFWHYIANRVLTTLCNMMTNLNLSDMEVGYKIFRAEFFKNLELNSERFGFEPEITVKGPSRAVGSMKCRSPTLGEPMQKGRKSAGGTGWQLFVTSSTTDSSTTINRARVKDLTMTPGGI